MNFVTKVLAMYDCLVARLAKIEWLPTLLVRLSLGWVFTRSGWGKWGNPEMVKRFAAWGIPWPEFQAPFAAATELACGFAILVGLCTRLACVPLIVVMSVAIIKVQMKEVENLGDFLVLDEFLYICVFVWLIVRGPGAVSLDRLLVALRPKLGLTPVLPADGAKS